MLLDIALLALVIWGVTALLRATAFRGRSVPIWQLRLTTVVTFVIALGVLWWGKTAGIQAHMEAQFGPEYTPSANYEYQPPLLSAAGLAAIWYSLLKRPPTTPKATDPASVEPLVPTVDGHAALSKSNRMIGVAVVFVAVVIGAGLMAQSGVVSIGQTYEGCISDRSGNATNNVQMRAAYDFCERYPREEDRRCRGRATDAQLSRLDGGLSRLNYGPYRVEVYTADPGLEISDVTIWMEFSNNVTREYLVDLYGTAKSHEVASGTFTPLAADSVTSMKRWGFQAATTCRPK